MRVTRRDKLVCEFFAGIGLVHEALRRSGWKCIYANDFDPKKRAMYEGNYGPSSHYHECDVWDTETVLARITERPYLATASFPCTDMSLAGHMRGFRGKESNAFFGFMEIIRRLGKEQPRLVLLENVPGFMHSHNGRDFVQAARELADCGYWLDSFVVDARFFVAQSRPRLFLLGYHEDIVGPPLVERRPEDSVFTDSWHQAIQRAPSLRPRRLVETIESTTLPTGWVTISVKEPRKVKYSLADFIDTGDSESWWHKTEVKRHYDMMFERHKERIGAMLSRRDVTVALTAFRRVREGQQRTEVRFDGIAGCLRTPRGGSAKQIVIVIQNGELKMRWMSPKEYGRLQGANSYKLPENVIQGLFGFGDAVCVPVIQWIDKHMLTPVFEASVSRGRQRRNGRSVFSH